MPGKKLLVADDSLTIQKVIRLALSNEGYEIQAVADGNDAINQILLFQPNVVLIDVSLPGKNAFEVKREVNGHEDLRETRFVLISSAFEKVDELQLEEVEFHGRLTKPFDPAHLRKVLTTVLAQVTQERMEPTSLLLRRPPPSPPEASQAFEYTRSNSNLPPLPMDPPPLQDQEFQLEENEDHPEMPPTPHLPDSANESDIHLLTESTMKISGMDDYQWSMNEPTMKPPPLMHDQGGSNFDLDPQSNNLPYSESSIQMPPPPLPMLDDSFLREESFMRNDSSLSNDAPLLDDAPMLGDLPTPEDSHIMDLPPLSPPPIEIDDLDNSRNSTSSYYPDPDNRSPILASEEKIDAMIHNQIEATLGKMIEKILPQIAEKLIKDEIHRLLSE